VGAPFIALAFGAMGGKPPPSTDNHYFALVFLSSIPEGNLLLSSGLAVGFSPLNRARNKRGFSPGLSHSP
jgi:hypothetical protein